MTEKRSKVFGLSDSDVGFLAVWGGKRPADAGNESEIRVQNARAAAETYYGVPDAVESAPSSKPWRGYLIAACIGGLAATVILQIVSGPIEIIQSENPEVAVIPASRVPQAVRKGPDISPQASEPHNLSVEESTSWVVDAMSDNPEAEAKKLEEILKNDGITPTINGSWNIAFEVPVTPSEELNNIATEFGLELQPGESVSITIKLDNTG